MKQEFGNRELIVQYLLGELSEQEKTQLEAHYFDDDDFFEELLVIEGDLTDAYVRDELSGRERERFEAHFLASPRRRQRVEIARGLMEYATQYATESSVPVSPALEARKPGAWWLTLLKKPVAENRMILAAFAMAVLLILAGGSLLMVQTFRLRNEVERIQADRAEMLKRQQELQQRLADQGAHNEQLADELQQERSQRELLEQELANPRRPTLSTITFILTPDLVRGAGGPKRLIIPQSADLVRIQLDLEQDNYKSYRVVLETVDSKRIWSSDSLKAGRKNSGKMVTLGLPASLFTRGDYIFTLSGVNADGSLEELGEYYFNVVKK